MDERAASARCARHSAPPHTPRVLRWRVQPLPPGVEVVVAAGLSDGDDACLFAWGGSGRSVAYLAPAVVMEDLRKTALGASEEFCSWRVDHLLESW